MRHVVIYHTGGGTTKFEGNDARYDVQVDGSLLISGWETANEIGTTTFAKDQWAQVDGSADKPQASRLVVTMGAPIPKP